LKLAPKIEIVKVSHMFRESLNKKNSAPAVWNFHIERF